MTVRGVDASHFQASLPDLTTLDFVFHKATQGASFVDSQYSARHAVVRGAGRVWGAYLFMTMTDMPSAQVAWFVTNARVLPGDVVALDFEDDGTWSQHSDASIAAIGSRVLSLLLAAFPRNQVLLYCDQNTYNRIVPLMGTPSDGLWIAAYNAIPPNVPWTFWQYADLPIDSDRGMFPDTLALHQWTMAKGVGMAGLASEWVVDYVAGRAWTVIECGSNSAVVSAAWVGGAALWGDMPPARVVMSSDAGVVLRSVTDVVFAQNKRLWWDVPSGTSVVTVEWDASVASKGVRFAPYTVYR